MILILISCNQSKQKYSPKIEIYLTENRIKSDQGIEVNESNIDKLDLRRLEGRFDFKIVRFDTINRDLIFAGSFKADKSDLFENPLITNADIISFNKNNGTIILNSIGAKKLSKLKNTDYGKQFVLIIDNKPKIYGYFFPTIFSYWCNTYHYPYMPDVNWTELDLKFGKESDSINL